MCYLDVTKGSWIIKMIIAQHTTAFSKCTSMLHGTVKVLISSAPDVPFIWFFLQLYAYMHKIRKKHYIVNTCTLIMVVYTVCHFGVWHEQNSFILTGS